LIFLEVFNELVYNLIFTNVITSTFSECKLIYARENSFTISVGGGRSCANNNEFVILLTDGNNNRVPPKPKDEANLLKSDNKFIIFVAIGSGVDINALNEIASVSGGTPQVLQTTFSTLGDIIDSLTMADMIIFCTVGSASVG
jgi:hypothetical protein